MNDIGMRTNEKGLTGYALVPTPVAMALTKLEINTWLSWQERYELAETVRVHLTMLAEKP